MSFDHLLELRECNLHLGLLDLDLLHGLRDFNILLGLLDLNLNSSRICILWLIPIY